jgi:hypothetical protein
MRPRASLSSQWKGCRVGLYSRAVQIVRASPRLALECTPTDYGRSVTSFTAADRRLYHLSIMSRIVTQAELLEIVPELRAMAATEPAEKVRDALNQLADRYTAASTAKLLADRTPGSGRSMPLWGTQAPESVSGAHHSAPSAILPPPLVAGIATAQSISTEGRPKHPARLASVS